jgi:hypothetical protein
MPLVFLKTLFRVYLGCIWAVTAERSRGKGRQSGNNGRSGAMQAMFISYLGYWDSYSLAKS